MIPYLILTFQYNMSSYPILEYEGPLYQQLLSLYQKESFQSLTDFIPSSILSHLQSSLSTEKYLSTIFQYKGEKYLCLLLKKDNEKAQAIIYPIVHHLYTTTVEHVVESLLTYIDFPVVITDLNNTIIDVNPTFEFIYGYSKEEVVGKSASILWSTQNDPELTNQILPHTLQYGSWKGKLYNKKKNGDEFLILLHTKAILDEEGKPQLLFSIAVDLSQEESKEKALLQEAYHSRLQQRKLLREFSEFGAQLYSALLPKENLFSAFFREYMVFIFSPRHYHFEKFYYFSHQFDTYFIGLVETNQRLLVGGYLSLVIYNLLNQIINEELITNPTNILQELQSRLMQIETILPLDEESKLEIRVGLFSISKKLHTARYASAGIPLFMYEYSKDLSSPVHSEHIEVLYDSAPITLDSSLERETHILKTNPYTRFYLVCSHFFQLPNPLQPTETLEVDSFKTFLSDISIFPLPQQKDIFYNRFEELAKKFQKSLLTLAVST